MKEITDILDKTILLEQMAEECAELTHALLKYARILRGENPTIISETDAYVHVLEEFSDVILCARTLDIPINENQIQYKLDRWTAALAF